MKIIAIHPHDGNTLWPFGAELIADSALGRDVMPLFLPDSPTPLRLSIVPAFRICRLGKNIPAKFALRYIEAVTPVAVLDTDGDFHRSGLSAIIDSRVTAGEWMPLDPATEKFTIDVTFTATGETSAVDIDLDDIALADTLHRLTGNTTVKTGDIIIFTTPSITTAPTDLTAAIAGRTLLTLRVK